jgi:hypothetical protein
MEEETMNPGGVNPLAQSHENDYSMMNSFLDFLSTSTNAAFEQHLVSQPLSPSEAMSLADESFHPDLVASVHNQLDALENDDDEKKKKKTEEEEEEAQKTEDAPAGAGRGRGAKKVKVLQKTKFFFFSFF